ncbi:MAG TPA: hypothetical protein VMU16_11030 [Candidatus Binataceae bacterium]|nr:hypothetical protein [Candidatus Binataceae bacterium]
MRVLLIPMLLAVPLAGGCQSESKQHLYAADDLAKKQDYEGARKELELAIQADPNNLEAHDSLAHIAEVLGDQELAGKEFDRASELDPTDQHLMDEARRYRQLKLLANSSDKALADIKAGQIDDGVSALKDLVRNRAVHDKALQALAAAIPEIEKQGDQQAAEKKYTDAFDTYNKGLHAAMLLTTARQAQQLEPEADPILQKAIDAAHAAGTNDAAFNLLQDVVSKYPDDKTANLALANIYLAQKPPDYDSAADLEERAGAPDDEVAKLRAKAKKHHKEPAATDGNG